MATHEIRNTAARDGGCGRQGSKDLAQEKEIISPPHAAGSPAGCPVGLRSSLPFRDGKGGRLYVYKQRTDFLQGQTGAGGLHPQRLEAVCETYAGLPEDQGMERLTGTGKESTSPTLH